MDLQMVKYERRYLDRLEIPGAMVEYKLKNGKSAKVELIDLTKISVRFYIEHIFTKEELIELTIIVKDKEKINVRGNVVWIQTAKENENNQANAVVQFLAFGTDENYNSLQSYELLAQIEKEYSNENDISNNIYKA